ncbi:MAG: DUF1989 domain-containing protein [Alphaproteobacteria bacterium]
MIAPDVLMTFDNVGYAARGRAFAGFPRHANHSAAIVEPHGVEMFSLSSGDLVQIESAAPPAVIWIVAVGRGGGDAAASLGLLGGETLDVASMPEGALHGWLRAHGLSAERKLPATRAAVPGEPLVLKAQADSTLWLVNAVETNALIEGQSFGSFTVTHSRQNARDAFPTPLGHVVEEIFVPRGTAKAYELRAGQKVQIIDLEGQQCSDFQAASARALHGGKERFIDSTATRSMVRHAYPAPGLLDKFYDVDMEPLLRVVRDTCGRHDTFGLACTARGYEERGFPGHVSCSDNISHALDPFGVERRSAWPAINLFWNTWLGANHQIMTEESWSRPGDYIVMEAMQDLVGVSTACPDDIDPINGWNPTDILVRIYGEKERISRAIGYREKEDSPMLTSEESAFHPRLSSLTEHFAPARDLWAPVSFPTHGTLGEYWACREAVTVQDMSGLRKFDIIGPDAEALLQLATTRNVSKLAVWRGQYTLMCDETGSVIDDGTLFRMAPDLFRWCCGTEESGRALQELAAQHSMQVRINGMRNALPNLAIQGPKSRDLLRRICFTQPHVPALDHLKWFGATVARLHNRDGVPFMIARSGYTGELGYEVFCAKADAVALWDAIMEAGDDLGVVPMGSAALNIIRIEAGLPAADAEFAPGVNAFEAGLSFAVDLTKSAFVGKAALERSKAHQAKALKGLVFDCNDLPAHGAPVFSGERQIGVITSATRSPSLETTIAIARLAVEFAEDDTALEVGQLDGRMKRLSARVVPIPFIDPQRTRARA